MKTHSMALSPQLEPDVLKYEETHTETRADPHTHAHTHTRILAHARGQSLSELIMATYDCFCNLFTSFELNDACQVVRGGGLQRLPQGHKFTSLQRLGGGEENLKHAKLCRDEIF